MVRVPYGRAIAQPCLPLKHNLSTTDVCMYKGTTHLYTQGSILDNKWQYENDLSDVIVARLSSMKQWGDNYWMTSVGTTVADELLWCYFLLMLLQWSDGERCIDEMLGVWRSRSSRRCQWWRSWRSDGVTAVAGWSSLSIQVMEIGANFAGLGMQPYVGQSTTSRWRDDWLNDVARWWWCSGQLRLVGWGCWLMSWAAESGKVAVDASVEISVEMLVRAAVESELARCRCW